MATKSDNQLISHLKANPFVLAPMAGITDCAFRSFMRELGASIVITELVSANGLEHGNQRTKDLMKFEESQRPFGIQLFGESPEFLANAARIAEREGADFVDLNFGCPVPKVVNKGAGSACLRDLKRLGEILRRVREAIQIPLTIKIRTGWDESSKNACEVVHAAHNEGVLWVSIHGRTRAQGYSGLADWGFISDVKAKAKIPIIGNGDIRTAKEANERLRESGCDGIMIGRGCLKNPWIFLESHNQFSNEGNAIITNLERDFSLIFEKLKSHLDRHSTPKVILIQLKKFAAWYSSGYPESSNFRKSIFTSKDYSEVVLTMDDYFSKLSGPQAKEDNEPFLMGGHG